jgi:hypothetical protein
MPPSFLESVGFLTLCGAGIWAGTWLVALGWGMYRMSHMYDQLSPVWQAKNYGVVYCDECNTINRKCRKCGHPLFTVKDQDRAQTSDNNERNEEVEFPRPCQCRECRH